MIRQLRLTPENLSAWLRERELISPGDKISVEQAGEGNINWVRRARVTRGPGAGRSWVVKQARPTLERFPEYPAPIERAVREAKELRGAFVNAATDLGIPALEVKHVQRYILAWIRKLQFR